MQLIRLVVTAFLLCAAHGAISQEAPSDNYRMEVELGDCLQDAGDDLARRACYKVPIELAESLLVAAYDLFMASSMPGIEKKKLQDVQNRWQQFRDADCQFREGLALSRPWPLSVKEDCFLAHVRQRTNELTWLAILHLPVNDVQGKLPLHSKQWREETKAQER